MNAELPPTLVYYPDSAPGITRRRCGRGFSYIAPDGTRIASARERRRIEALGVPPAYEDVWICPRPNGHLQATGLDARARKQYRYHADWTAYRALRKFDHLAEFGAFLPAIRRRILNDLRGEAGEKSFAVAAVLALLDRASLRVGNADYAAENGTYGATTLRGSHVSLSGGAVRFSYRSKGGKMVRSSLRDATLNRTLARLHDLPGKALISYLGADGRSQQVSSDAVNTALAEMTGDAAMTAKTFRTWNGSVAALDAALRADHLTVKTMAEAAADRLSNTPAIARGSYIHPAVIDLAGTEPADRREMVAGAEERRGLRRSEAQLLCLLERR
jgi:DNA topoisomerase-1